MCYSPREIRQQDTKCFLAAASVYGRTGLLTWLCVWSGMVFAHAESKVDVYKNMDAKVLAHLTQLGEGVVIQEIDAPVLNSPAQWVGRSEGEYLFRFVTGDDHGKTEQMEIHKPDPHKPNVAWSRHIGDTMIEDIAVVDGQGVSIHTETDAEHGFRIEIHPGINIPTGAKKGDSWQEESALTIYDLDAPDKIAHRGTMSTVRRYLGAYKVRLPAGDFDAILLEEDYRIHVGPLKGTDTRYVFYSKGLGVVAEVEGIRASAVIVFHMKSDSAKVLVSYPK